MVHKTEFRYIVRNDEILRGEPIIEGTRTPVRAIVEYCRLGIPAEEIPLHLPYLSLEQVLGALTYYDENSVEIEEYIEANRIPEELIGTAMEFSPREQTIRRIVSG